MGATESDTPWEVGLTLSPMGCRFRLMPEGGVSDTPHVSIFKLDFFFSFELTCKKLG